MDYKRLIVVVIVTIVFGQSQINGFNGEEETKNSTKFTLDLYRTMFDENENTIVSPFSFRAVLSILYHGVINNSETELRDKVYLGDREETLNSQIESFQRYSANRNIKVVNKIYLREGGILKKSFLKAVNEMNGHIEEVDFHESVITAEKMNTWVEEQTNGLIKDLVKKESVTQDTGLFLLNALYFKAQWKIPFDIDNVREYPFTGIDGVVKRIQTIFDQGSYNVAKLHNIHAEVLEIPYTEDSNFVFWILLPSENSNITQLKNLLSYDIIKEISQKFKSEIIELNFPPFEIETSIDGKKVLRKLGFNSLFDERDCTMLENEFLLVDELKQKSKIIVNTNGTEAAAASYAKMAFYSMFPEFSVTRPFIYMILTADAHEPVFIGHFSKP